MRVHTYQQVNAGMLKYVAGSCAVVVLAGCLKHGRALLVLFGQEGAGW